MNQIITGKTINLTIQRGFLVLMSCFSVPQQLNRNTTIERQQFFVRQEKDKKGKKRNIKISNTPN